MRRLVIDASVAIKWVIEEPGTAEALALRRYRLLAPELLIPECANILWKKVRRGEIGAAEASMAAQLLERSDLELMPMRQLFGVALQLAIEFDHPAYDCLYLALAQANGCSLVTADSRFCNRMRGRVPQGQVLDLASALEHSLIAKDH